MAHDARTSRILIADENLLFRRGLQFLVSSNPAFQVCGEASTSEQVLERVRSLSPDVLIIDVNLLDSTDRSLGLKLRQLQSRLRILVLAHQDNAEGLQVAITARALGFMLKQSGAAQLLKALNSVAFHDGGMNLSGLIPDLQALAVKTAVNSGSLLTPREQEVVKLLAEGKTVRLVARELAVSMKTVEAHKLNLMRKLDIHNRASLVAYAGRQGLVASETMAS